MTGRKINSLLFNSAEGHFHQDKEVLEKELQESSFVKTNQFIS